MTIFTKGGDIIKVSILVHNKENSEANLAMCSRCGAKAHFKDKKDIKTHFEWHICDYQFRR